MTQKTVSLSEQVYELLKREKREGESFSDVIERLLTREKNPWITIQKKFDPEVFEGLKERISRIREEDLTGSD